MKTINTYISEKLRLTNKPQYTCQPKDWGELHDIILQRIEDEGPQCDLNDIDTSKITDMSELFDEEKLKDFNGNISLWDVSNVKYMPYMFHGCKKFNCDLSMWNVSNVEDMQYMFAMCHEFDCDLSKWNVSNVEDMEFMFYNCKKFNQNLNSWDVQNVIDMHVAFHNCPAQPKWYDKNKWED